jgi:glycine cleavage system H protein
MNNRYAVLPCNGIDKCAGCISKEIALILADKGSEIICPVLYRVAPARFDKLAQDLPLIVIDGCSTRCASKLAGERNMKIIAKLNVSEYAKQKGVELGKSLRLSESDIKFAQTLANELLASEKADTGAGSVPFPKELQYEVYKKGKFIFRVPTDDNFYFNENDVWAYVSGNRARIGVTDFVQKSLSDITFFTQPTIGNDIEQFEEAGSIESSKAVFEIISPVSGRIVAFNSRLIDAPELINENPYEQGWIAEVELSDFETDQELLHKFDGYFSSMKKKVDEFNV